VVLKAAFWRTVIFVTLRWYRFIETGDVNCTSELLHDWRWL